MPVEAPINQDPAMKEAEATMPPSEQMLQTLGDVALPGERLAEAERPLPPLAPGNIRLYRGDVVDQEGNPIVEIIEGRNTAPETAGRWFTDDPNVAEGYGTGRHIEQDNGRMRLRFIDLPKEFAMAHNTRNLPSDVMSRANGTGGLPEEWLLPPEVIDQAQEYQVKQVERIYEPEVATGLEQLFGDPQLADYLAEMNVDATNQDAIQEILQNPDQVRFFLEQLGMGVGQDYFPVTDKALMAARISELYKGVKSAHKERYIGLPPAPAAFLSGPMQADNPQPASNEFSDDW